MVLFTEKRRSFGGRNRGVHIAISEKFRAIICTPTYIENFTISLNAQFEEFSNVDFIG